MTSVIAFQWVVCLLLTLSSLGVILLRKPVHASLSFLLTLMMLAVLYLQLSAQFIAVMQILVYAGAIMVIFMFVVVLFQDAYQQIALYEAKSSRLFLFTAVILLLLAIGFWSRNLVDLALVKETKPENFGTVQALGQALYLDFFFPFEAVTLLFLIAAVGAVYVARKEK
ncbi:NADH-quinone oxidoreductase subunit J [Candidatus Protochlamydia phocaeensis]|uniref:NADH-quinone oxidoreductase subunit J family protein n=1 Tax=Candidatus Protochlamydia phocaeensis TaxID=1414722 RepID=UPI000837C9A6|nr:NADH-quinone oxidoreductase subunit J [Candidatus Protochlamydia phocaeensis]